MYPWLKLLHIAAVVLFLGNIYTGLFWKAHADRTRDPRIIAHAIEGIIRSDQWFTLPGVFLILLGGIGAAYVGQMPLLRVPWIAWSLALFAASGVAFVLRVAPMQRRLLALAQRGVSGEMPWEEYQAASRSWLMWGHFALATPILALVLMVLKPV